MGWADTSGFLKKSGYIEYNHNTDEYVRYDPKKLSHLSTEIVGAVLKKANCKKQ